MMTRTIPTDVSSLRTSSSRMLQLRRLKLLLQALPVARQGQSILSPHALSPLNIVYSTSDDGCTVTVTVTPTAAAATTAAYVPSSY